jgi:ferredoxin
VGRRSGSRATFAAGAFSVKVTVNAERCQGHARCHALAPEIFDVDDYGQSTVRGDGTVLTEFVDRVRLAVANCPELAIALDEA